MPRYRIERTQIETRVYFVDAANEDEALFIYMEEDCEDETQRYHQGQTDERITEVTEEPTA